MSDRIFSTATISPETVPAGDSVEFTIRLQVTKEFSSDGTRIIFDMPAYLGYSRPSTFDHEEGGYVEIFISNPDIRYSKRAWDMEIMDFPTREKRSFRGMAARLLVIDMFDGPAKAGDEIILKWGFVREGYSIGAKVCTVVPQVDFKNHVHVRYFQDVAEGLPDLGRSFKGYERPVPFEEIELEFTVTPREPVGLRVFKKRDKKMLMVHDRFVNACQDVDAEDYVEPADGWIQNPSGVFELPDPKALIVSNGLPLREGPDLEGVYEGLNVYFGDFHTHSAYSNDCIEREKMEINPAAQIAHARDAKALDFIAITDHHQPWDKERNKIGEEHWNDTVRACADATVNDEFAAFSGIEFRGPRGDTVVVFEEDVPYMRIDNPEINDIRALWDEFDGHPYITIPHFHNPGSLAPNEWFLCPYPGIEPYLEIYSCHGSYESDHVNERHIPGIKAFRKDRNGAYFLKRGFRYGFGCNSDGHKGNPGTNGLTAVYSPTLSKAAILDAVKKRNIYGTTNARIRVLMTVNGSLMGSEISGSGTATIHIDVHGEGNLKAVDILKNGDLYQRFRPEGMTLETDIEVDADEPASWYARVTQLDNHIAYTSPVWVD